MNIDFERQAVRGEPIPRQLDIVDSCLYMALVYLYKAYRAGLMGRDEAKREKDTLLYNYATDKSKIEFLNRNCLGLSKRIDCASEEYRKSPSIETANRLYAAFYNLPDDWEPIDNTTKL